MKAGDPAEVRGSKG